MGNGPSFNQRVETWDKVAHDDQRVREAIAPSRHRPEGYEQSGRNHADKLIELVGEHDWRVLDFGCGDGRVTCHLTDHFDEVWGADASIGMLDRLRTNCPDVRPVLWDGVNSSDRPVGEFDLICSFLCFLHHTYEDGSAMLAGLARALKPGGLLAFQLPLYDRYRKPVGWTSVGTWTSKQLVNAAQDAGLIIDSLHANRGRYVPGEAGPNHGALHLLHRPE